MANGGKDHSVIMIGAGKTEWQLHPSAGNEACCIFRVPQCLAEIHPKTYQPHVVSIGPYHYGKPHLQMMQEHKQRYLGDLLARTASTGPKLDEYLQAVESREKDIRDCYSENIKFGSGDLVEIMVLDGLFIIELFCKEFKGLVSQPQSHGDDPIFNLAWVKPNLIRDLLRLENQIPFFVLQILFDKSKALRNDSQLSLSKLALQFISYAVERPEKVLNQQFEAKNLLDLVRLSFAPQPLDHPSHPPPDKKLKNTPSLLLSISPARTPLKGIKSNAWEAVKKLLAGIKWKTQKADTVQSEETPLEGESVQLIKSARKLYKSGIKFKTVAGRSSLDIKFRNGVLKIPNILLDDLRADLFLNFVAFEQHRYFLCPSRHITSYAAFMSCLIRTPEDATFLRDKDIIDNYLGTDEEVANFFRTLGKDVTFDIDESYLCKLFKDVNKYQRNVLHVTWGEFKFKYFDSPWSFVSALAAVIVLLLTVLQTFYTVYEYSHPQQSG
ncbi:UPF0481 protein At3g47200-like [Rosa rugosa]|uniref:UPF0481 protein At3g47200-like n=1 Tax=Rosa rugosa TaxID=74645 RepID=UPI002B406E9C|nr:UPF0481 protein At3g47200-like [Rosa rugosa]